jgi:hypothetical protein
MRTIHRPTILTLSSMLAAAVFAATPASGAPCSAGPRVISIDGGQAAVPALQKRLATQVQRAARAGCVAQSGQASAEGHCHPHLAAIARTQDEIRRGAQRRAVAVEHLPACETRARIVRLGEPNPAFERNVVTISLPSDAAIPLPSWRPDAQARLDGTDTIPEAVGGTAAAPSEAEYRALLEPRDIPQDRRGVRVVGTKFLPPESERIDFAAVAQAEQPWLNRMLSDVVAYLGGAEEESSVAEATSAEAGPLLTASAE